MQAIGEILLNNCINIRFNSLGIIVYKRLIILVPYNMVQQAYHIEYIEYSIRETLKETKTKNLFIKEKVILSLYLLR